MKRFLVGLAAAVLAGSAAKAATLDGDTFLVTYVTKGTAGVQTFGSFTPPVFAVPAPGGTGQFADDVITYTFDQAVDFSTLGLETVTFTDTSSSRITGASYEAGSLQIATLSTTADSLTVDFSQATATVAAAAFISIGLDVSGPVSAVPLPASLPLFGGAVFALALVGRKFKVRARWVEATSLKPQARPAAIRIGQGGPAA